MNPAEPKLIETSPPSGVTLALAWAFFWRSFLWSILVFFLLILFIVVALFVSGAMGSIEELAKGPPPGFELIVWVFWFGAWFWVCWRVLRKMLGKTFGGYRLVLLTPQAGAGMEPPRDAAAPHPDSF